MNRMFATFRPLTGLAGHSDSFSNPMQDAAKGSEGRMRLELAPLAASKTSAVA